MKNFLRYFFQIYPQIIDYPVKSIAIRSIFNPLYSIPHTSYASITATKHVLFRLPTANRTKTGDPEYTKSLLSNQGL